MIRAGLLTVASLVLCGCGRYADFTLPSAGESKAGNVRWTWEARPEPVQSRGPSGSYDATDALNPSVVRAGSQYLNVFSGYDGKAWHTAVATSPDGLAWSRGAKVLSPDAGSWEGDYISANGSALVDGSRILYWYQGGRVPRIGLAISNDGGRTFTRNGPGPVLEVGPRGSWDERGVADPYVLKNGSTYFMYYLGQDRARRQQIGVARSTDGVRWEKYRGNPVLELGPVGAFDETGLGEPAVWQEQGSYWMLYTARDPKEYRRIGLARSQDGVHWSRVMGKPVITGEHSWDSAVVCDPTVEPSPEGVRVWFGGGNRPEPAENLNGQIGFGILRLRIEP